MVYPTSFNFWKDILDRLVAFSRLQHSAKSRSCSWCKMQMCGLISICYTCPLQAALSVCFWFQLKMPVITYKALQDTGLGYLRDHVYPGTSTCPIRYSRRGKFWVPSTKELHLRGGTLSAMAPTFGGIIPWR